MRIEIKNLCGLALPLDVPKDAMTKYVKKLIFGRLGVFPNDQNLIFQGRLLEDDEQISEIGIQPGEVIYLALNTVLEDDADLLVEANILCEYEKDDFVEGNLALFTSPEAFQVMSRTSDLQFTQFESVKGGLNELIRNHYEVENFYNEQEKIERQKILFSAQNNNDLLSNIEYLSEFTIIPELGEENTEPNSEPMPFIFFEEDLEDVDNEGLIFE